MDVTALLQCNHAMPPARAMVGAAAARIAAARGAKRRRTERGLHEVTQRRLMTMAVELRAVPVVSLLCWTNA